MIRVVMLKICLQMATQLDLERQVCETGHRSILWDLRGRGAQLAGVIGRGIHQEAQKMRKEIWAKF